MIDDMSYREILIVYLLYKQENQNPHNEEENDLQRATRFWDLFRSELLNRFEIKGNEVNPILRRITRTGLVEMLGCHFDQYVCGDH